MFLLGTMPDVTKTECHLPTHENPLCFSAQRVFVGVSAIQLNSRYPMPTPTATAVAVAALGFSLAQSAVLVIVCSDAAAAASQTSAQVAVAVASVLLVLIVLYSSYVVPATGWLGWAIPPTLRGYHPTSQLRRISKPKSGRDCYSGGGDGSEAQIQKNHRIPTPKTRSIRVPYEVWGGSYEILTKFFQDRKGVFAPSGSMESNSCARLLRRFRGFLTILRNF